jgi:hypothetical protein
MLLWIYNQVTDIRENHIAEINITKNIILIEKIAEFDL